MRIDLFLKQSRLIKRRTVAKGAATKDLIIVNDKIVKPSYQVKVNDLITLNLGSKQIIVKVTSLIPKKDELMYDLISESFIGQKN
ncbi:RNA-binding S4 domain-containing protein [Haploplasma modicum]|jgi:ribosomal 50S subunit-recycling heat shock protein|uniref:RNA-binding S4 domain-containing protein n=1 Tax=Haploplasma modicum TaxID=2150 RepID=UPI00047B4037|nr:S4 domain-containing protein [Haploplasma modicum]MCR1809187.1 S4 domain-containing protein [Haploplasma modicum]